MEKEIQSLSDKAEKMAKKAPNGGYEVYGVIVFDKKSYKTLEGVFDYDAYYKGYVLHSPMGLRGYQIECWFNNLRHFLREECYGGVRVVTQLL